MPRIPVLVVDDDESERNLCALELRLAGFDVQTAGDGIAALRLMETFRPAVMILDLRMPLADGFDVVRELCANPFAQGTSVIVVSGDDRGVAAARGDAAVFAAFEKPVLTGDLIGAIMRAVRGRDQSAPS
jgi:DNA-binding response OmpR family regulator